MRASIISSSYAKVFQRLEAEIEDLVQFTKDIARLPYDPESWLNRAHCLRLLGFPELGLGDAYKARLLVEAALENTSSLGVDALKTFSRKVYNLHMTDPAWQQWRSHVSIPELLQSRVTGMLKRIEIQCWTELMEGLMASNCCNDYVEMSKEAISKFPSDEVFPSELDNANSWYQQRVDILEGRVETGDLTAEQMAWTLVNGGVYPTPYPWIPDDLLSRDEDLFKIISDEFAIASTNCTVSRSTIRNVSDDDGSISNIDVLGVTATREIRAGETVVLDTTFSGVIGDVDRCEYCCGVAGTVTNACCKVLYCSQSCAKEALENYHPALCGKDFSSFHAEAKLATLTTDFSLGSLLLLRTLANSIHENHSHPLKSSVLSRLTPTYGMKEPKLIIFNFLEHVISPIIMLRELGIDVFADDRYDSWVIHTMRCRLQNNKHGQTLDDVCGTAIGPLYSMFNHSCAPSVDWRHDDNNSNLTMFAERDIREGEEMFISYIKSKSMGRAERQKTLMPWLGMDCACTRCVAEKYSN
jgi:hypothetical protein